tara:strand:+ start:243 stop:623 length:381 start_codon:yes stop_codon:yes gene_type:complete
LGAGSAAVQKLIALQVSQSVNGTAILKTDYYGNSLPVKYKPLNDSIWHNAVLVLSSEVLTIYVDGEKVDNRPFPLKTTSYVFSNIGGSHMSNQTLLGEIDDLRIYNRALTEEQVKALYEWEKPKAE